MSKVKCEECDGKGERYLKIAGDVHIARCACCDGFGVVASPRVTEKPPAPSKFGSVNINELLGE
jgi:hypothetical protein